jgi:hypothetical protein
MSGISRRLRLIALTILGLSAAGCGSGRPPGVANQPGDSFVELTDLSGELALSSAELKIRVHYKFPDDLPHPDAWFQFFFELNEGKSGAVVVRRRGRELSDEGDIDASGSIAFLRRKEVRIAAKVQQSKSKNGPWHDVSDTVITDSN